MAQEVIDVQEEHDNRITWAWPRRKGLPMAIASFKGPATVKSLASQNISHVDPVSPHK